MSKLTIIVSDLTVGFDGVFYPFLESRLIGFPEGMAAVQYDTDLDEGWMEFENGSIDPLTASDEHLLGIIWQDWFNGDEARIAAEQAAIAAENAKWVTLDAFEALFMQNDEAWMSFLISLSPYSFFRFHFRRRRNNPVSIGIQVIYEPSNNTMTGIKTSGFIKEIDQVSRTFSIPIFFDYNPSLISETNFRRELNIYGFSFAEHEGGLTAYNYTNAT
jgi:hypothetical protein